MIYEPVDSFEYKGFTVEIYPDFDPPSPREWDNLGTMVCWHRRYILGDEHDFTTPDDFAEWAKGKKLIIKPLYLIDHSGLSMNTHGYNCCDPQGWDWGQVGWIYVTYEDALRRFGRKRMSRKLRRRIERILENEVRTYDAYLSGQVYGFVVKLGDKELDSCFGFYGEDGLKDLEMEAKGLIDAYIRRKYKEHAERVKAWIKHKVPLIYRHSLRLI